MDYCLATGATGSYRIQKFGQGDVWLTDANRAQGYGVRSETERLQIWTSGELSVCSLEEYLTYCQIPLCPGVTQRHLRQDSDDFVRDAARRQQGRRQCKRHREMPRNKRRREVWSHNRGKKNHSLHETIQQGSVVANPWIVFALIIFV
jgi:hypothetical protein